MLEKGEQEEKTYTKVEHDGVIKDLQSERTQRQQAQFDLDANRRELESLRKTVEELKNSKPVEFASDKIKFDGDDEDPAKIKDVKSGFKSIEKEAVAKFAAAQKAAKTAAEAEIAKTKFDDSCRQADIKYANRESIGLGFKEVYQAAIRRIGRNKYDELAIYHSANPGERLYEEGCKDPAIKAKLDLEENQELLKDMATRKVDKEILTGGAKVKSNEYFTPQEVSNMTALEAKDNLPKIEKSMKWWEEQRKGTK